MPKDPTKNVDRYKIRGGNLNEFEFTQNQAEFTVEETLPTNLIPGTPPEVKAFQAEGLAKKVQKRSTKKPAKATGKKAAGTKKLSKRASSKKTTKRAGSKKSSKRSGKKGATAKKSAAKKTTKKRAAKK